MNLELSESALHGEFIAREYANVYPQPHVVEAELNDGVLPERITRRDKKRALELGFKAQDVPGSHGLLELPLVLQVPV